MERRFWYGLGILVLFLALGLWAAWGMENMHVPVTNRLEQAAQAALNGELDKGVALAEQAEDLWEKRRNLTAAMADHGPMEEIDSLFSQTRIYAESGSIMDFAAYCSRIAKLVEAVGEAHGLNWQNLL